MKENSASFTAEMMALYRAMETRRPEAQRLFTDPYASCFLGPRLRLASWIAAFPTGERWLYRYMQHRIPGALASGIARTRYIDDLLERRLQGGIKQVILLGAGFDTRAMRLPRLRDISVLEIDHPDTAKRKQTLLRKAIRERPANVRYLSVDLNLQSLGQLFKQQGINISKPTVIIWEGVTNYLKQKAVEDVMRVTSSFPSGSAIIFTYIHRSVLEEPTAWWGAARLLSDLQRLQEKWTFGFLPEELAAWLLELGLHLVEDKGAAEYRETYMPERKILLKGYEFYRVAEAEVCS
jgi:methyltransferase (TIGR00027 family)